MDIIKLFLGKDIDLNCIDLEGKNLLQILCGHYEKGNLKNIIELIFEKYDQDIDKKLSDIDHTTNDGLNALHILCSSYTKENLTEIVELFLKRNISVNCTNNYGWKLFRFLP